MAMSSLTTGWWMPPPDAVFGEQFTEQDGVSGLFALPLYLLYTLLFVVFAVLQLMVYGGAALALVGVLALGSAALPVLLLGGLVYLVYSLLDGESSEWSS
eukprot:RCo031390